MTLKEIEDRLTGKYQVTKITILQNFVLKVGSRGSITVQYKDGQMTKIIVDGKEKEDLELLLGVKK